MSDDKLYIYVEDGKILFATCWEWEAVEFEERNGYEYKFVANGDLIQE